MKITAEPRSDQWNAEDFLGGPRTFTVAGVKVGAAEQKYDIQLEGEQRVWRPPLTVLRILIKCWGDEASAWAGKRVTLFCDERVTFGRDAVGGIRVSHVSHIDKPLTLNLTATRGKRQKVTVQPLKEQAAPAQPAYDLDALDVDGLRALYMDRKAAGATPDELAQIQAAAQNKENK